MSETDVLGDDIFLFNADCRVVIPTLARPSAVITDPPYGIGVDPSVRRPSNYQRKAGMLPREWDMEPADVSTLIGLADVVVLWGGNYFMIPPSRCWFVWHKPDAPPTMSNVELAWTNLNQNARQFSHSIAATNAERIGHPTQKAIAVMRWCIQQCGLPAGSTILDPYMGSGTTGVAAVGLGHKFIGIERDPEHYATALRRLTHATGAGPGQLFRAAT